MLPAYCPARARRYSPGRVPVHFLKARWKALAAGSPNLSFVPVASGDSPPDLGPLLAAVPGLAGREAWLCGPPGLNAAASRALRQAGVPAEAIHFESFEFRS